MKKVVYSLLLACLFVFSSHSVNAVIVTRAAIDVGSSETKLTVADVDTDSNQIVLIRFQDFITVELRKDISASSDGCLSIQAEDKLVAALMEFKRISSEYDPQAWAGIGTSALRVAKNGQEFIERVNARTGVTIRIIPQFEEGEVGFFSAVAAGGFNANEVIAWDSGSGSFQITSLKEGNIQMYGAEFAFVPALDLLLKMREERGIADQSINPIQLTEAIDLVAAIQDRLPELPSWMLEKIYKKYVGFGGNTSIFSMASITTGQTSFNKSQVWEAVVRLCGSTDEQLTEFPEPKNAVLRLILLYAVMDHCNMNKLTYCYSNGGCEGLLVMPKYWP